MCASHYVIITPAHNEESFIRYTLNSVVAQTIQPAQWIIVDDGSNDGTVAVVQVYADVHPWIKIVKNVAPNTHRRGGGKIVRAFLRGYDALDILDFEFIVKLDADLTLPQNYFEEVGKAFATDTSVGMCGGFLSELSSSGTWNRAKSADYHLRGAIKAYRRRCFDQIGGIQMVHNWDLVDEMKAMFLGWGVKILPLEVKHHRRTSALINRGWSSSFTMGQQYYKDGYDMFLAFCRSATFGARTKPYLLTSFGFLLGFLYSCWHKPQKEVDPGLEAFIRRFQYARIVNTLLRKS